MTAISAAASMCQNLTSAIGDGKFECVVADWNCPDYFPLRRIDHRRIATIVGGRVWMLATRKIGNDLCRSRHQVFG
jgi:hypothetical protein